MARVYSTLSARNKKRLYATARSMGITPSEAIRHAIDLYVTQDEQEREDEKREERRTSRRKS